MRPPTLDEVTAMFLARYRPDDQDPDKLEKALAYIRDALLVGSGRAHVRRMAADRAQRTGRVRSYPHLIASDRAVVERVAHEGGLPVGALLARDGSRTASRWRFLAMWTLAKTRRRSQPEIAAVLNRSNHQCVGRGLRIAEAEVARDPKLADRLRRLAV